MPRCEMRQAATGARRAVSGAGAHARLVIENDLRRLVGLLPLGGPPEPYEPDTAPPGLYCRALRRLAGWLLPRQAEAQTPPGAAAPPPHLHPVSQLFVTPGPGGPEERR